MADQNPEVKCLKCEERKVKDDEAREEVKKFIKNGKIEVVFDFRHITLGVVGCYFASLACDLAKAYFESKKK